MTIMTTSAPTMLHIIAYNTHHE